VIKILRRGTTRNHRRRGGAYVVPGGKIAQCVNIPILWIDWICVDGVEFKFSQQNKLIEHLQAG